MLVNMRYCVDFHPKVLSSQKTPRLAPHMKVGVCAAIISLNSQLNDYKYHQDFFPAMLKMNLSQKS